MCSELSKKGRKELWIAVNKIVLLFIVFAMCCVLCNQLCLVHEKAIISGTLHWTWSDVSSGTLIIDTGLTSHVVAHIRLQHVEHVSVQNLSEESSHLQDKSSPPWFTDGPTTTVWCALEGHV